MAKPPARRENDEPPAYREGYAGFQVTGKDPSRWARLRVQLMGKVHDLVEKVGSDDPMASFLREQAKEFGNLLLDHAKAKLRREGVEVQKIEADVSKTYAEKEESLARAREINAKARTIEIRNSAKELRLALGMTKAMLIGDDGEE